MPDEGVDLYQENEELKASQPGGKFTAAFYLLIETN